MLGSCLYRFIVAIALRFDVPPEALKLVSAIIVAVAIGLPYLKKQFRLYQSKRAAKVKNQRCIDEILAQEKERKEGQK